MKNVDKLVSIIANAGYAVPDNAEIKSFMRRKVKHLFDTNKYFKKFLISNTEFLPLDTLVRVRWEYYSNGYTAPKTCVCGNTIYKNFEHKFCSHECSTTIISGKKRGPKVDLALKETEFKKSFKSKEFKLVKFGYPKSTFKHTCGLVLDAENYRMLKGHRKCECQHSRVMKHSLESLAIKFEDTDWVPRKILEGKLVRFKNKYCGHNQSFAHDLKNKNQVCHTCHTKYASNIITHEDYVSKLRISKPEYQVLSKYKNIKSSIKYKHRICGCIFETTAEKMGNSKACPECFSSSYKVVVINGVRFKVQGREDSAIEWIVNHTSIRASAITLRSEVPKFKYDEYAGNRKRRYFPDFYIKSRNLIVEVKDVTSSGLLGKEFFRVPAKNLWYTLCRKAQAVLDAGYKFRVLIFNGNERIKLPKDWHKMSYSQIRKWYG